MLVACIAGTFGAIVGSFLNVVIVRRGVQGIGGHSACPQCGARIAWHDLVPIISWLVLKGRCRSCGSSISVQYPLVEAGTALLFAAIVPPLIVLGSVLSLLCSLVCVCMLVCIFVYDLRHTIIPDTWVYVCCIAAFVGALLISEQSLIFTLLAGPIASAPLFGLWLYSRGTWMGFGDVKLALAMGWLLGFPDGLFAVFAGFVLGSVVLVPLMLLGQLVTHTGIYVFLPKGLTMRSEVPFGPFLIASTFIVWISLLYGYNLPELVGWYSV